MRRKSDRKKAKSSPEKKIEKPKRGRSSKRRKRSSSSPDNESVDEGSPQPIEIIDSSEQSENIIPKMSTPQKEQTMTEEGKLDQVWQVKTAESSGDSGEIQKLKICLTRPAVTPERPDKSPRSRKRLNRNHSQSDTSGAETVDEKRKSRHRSKRSTRESRDTEDGMEERDSPALSVETAVTSVTSTVTKVDSVSEVDSVENTQNDEVSSPSVQSSAKVQLDEQTTDTVEIIRGEESEAANSASVSASTQQSSPIAHKKQLTPEKQIVESTQSEPIQPMEVCESTETLDASKSTIENEQNCDKPQIVQKDNSEMGNDSESTSPRNGGSSVEGCKTDAEKKKIEKDVKENKTVSSNECDKLPNEASLMQNQQESESKALSPDQTKERQDNQIVVSTSDSKTEETVSHEESVLNHSPVREISDLKETSVSESPVHKSPPNSMIESLPTISSITPDTDMKKPNSAQTTVTRKRRWGTRTSKVSKTPVVNISTDSLKDIISDVQPAPLNEVIHEKRPEKVEKPPLPKIVIDNSVPLKPTKVVEKSATNTTNNALGNLSHRKISIVKEDHNVVARPPSPPKHKSSAILFISNLVRPFTLAQLKNLLQRTGKIMDDGFWIDKIKSRCYVKYETEDQAVETRHALHGVTWPMSNPKTLQVDFAAQEALDAARVSEDNFTVTRTSPIPGTVEDWHRQQDAKKENFREKDEARMWERKNVVREWDMGKGEKEKERPKDKLEPRRRHRTPERSPEPARKFKKKEEEAPAKLLDDLFKKTKTIPCIYWLPLTAETVRVPLSQSKRSSGGSTWRSTKGASRSSDANPSAGGTKPHPHS